MGLRPIVGVLLILAGCSSAPSASPSESLVPVASAERSVTPSSAAATAATAEVTASPTPLTWSELEAVGPAPREDHTWTVGPDRTAFLFGGRDGATAFADLWAFDLDSDSWTELDPGRGPAARFGHEATWVDGVGLVIFAGQMGSTFFDDLWAFDPATTKWTELPGDGDRPVARYGTCAALGPDGRLWISHGFTADLTRFSDTRAYDFEAGAWTDETPAGDRPVERCLHGCWWTDDGALMLYAGQTTGVTALGDRWTLAGGSWVEATEASPPDRNLYARARSDGATLLFGGQAVDGSFLGDLWLLPDAGEAVLVTPAGTGPSPRAGSELVRDFEADRYLLFGGRDADGGLGDLWQLHGGVHTEG